MKILFIIIATATLLSAYFLGQILVAEQKMLVLQAEQGQGSDEESSFEIKSVRQ